MRRKEVLNEIKELIDPFKITQGDHFRLKDIDPADTRGLRAEQKKEAKEWLEKGVAWLADLQDRLYAQDRWGVLVVIQAMDAAGKDGTIKHVMSGVNPQGCQVYGFKQPSSEDLNHDYLWRYIKCLPERGKIGIFNRSYYEEVLIVRVHEEVFNRQKIPPELVSKHIWDERLADIKALERYLSANGIIPIKFYLHLSKEEQRKRFLERIDLPEKNWKFSDADLKERGYWKDYMKAYEEAIRATASKHAPWYVVPADNKWFTRLVVAAAVVETMEKLDLEYPKVSPQQLKALAKAKNILQRK